MITSGSLVEWNPAEDIGKILPEETAEVFGARLPLAGIMARYQKLSGGTGTIPVKVEELREVRI